MTHRKYSRSRNAIHKSMARHPGARQSKHMRLEQSAIDRKDFSERYGHSPLERILPILKEQESLLSRYKPKPLPTTEHSKNLKGGKGFIRRLFNRKTGGFVDLEFMVLLVLCGCLALIFLGVAHLGYRP